MCVFGLFPRTSATGPPPIRIHLDFRCDFPLVSLDLFGADPSIFVAVEPLEEAIGVGLHFIAGQRPILVPIGPGKPARDRRIACNLRSVRLAHWADEWRPGIGFDYDRRVLGHCQGKQDWGDHSETGHKLTSVLAAP